MTLPRILNILFLFAIFILTIVFTSYYNLSTFKYKKKLQDNYEDEFSDDNLEMKLKYKNHLNNNNHGNKQLYEIIEELQNEIFKLRQRLDQVEEYSKSYNPSESSKRYSSKFSKFSKTKFLPYSEKKRILITGGAGFVGSHLLDRLLSDGHEVIVADNFFTGRRSNIEHWLGHPNFELLHHDIINPLYVEVDEIYHLASPASPPHYMFNAVKTIKTNTIGTINMLGLAKRVGARILVASTSEVYGDPNVHPQSETYWGNVNPIGPRSCYDEGKRVAEALTYAYAKQEKVNVRVARIFNTYGPRMNINDGRVVSNFISQALQNESLTIYGKGKQTRSFQYVTDLIEGLVRLMDSNYTKPVNLGNPDEYTINAFANIILDLIHSKFPDTTIQSKDYVDNINDKYNLMVTHLPAQQDDPRRRRPDISLARSILNWYPKITLIEGLNKTIDYFRLEMKQSLGEN